MGVDVTSLPCGGCKFCEKVHKQWSTFEEEVDGVVPLVVKQVVSTNNEPLILRNTEKLMKHLIVTVQIPMIVPKKNLVNLFNKYMNERNLGF